MDQITIQNLEIFAKHGVYPEENVLGQKFLISAILHLSTRKAGLSDDLAESVNYGEVCHFIKQYTESHTHRLLETLAEELASRILLTFPLVQAVDLEIKKPWAPIGLPLETVSLKISRKWHKAYIALGSNMGDRKAYLDLGVKRLQENKDCRVTKVADYLETEPYGGVEQDAFLNSVLELRTLLPPYELLDLLHEIEQEAKRERLIRWGPRTLDLDIIMYDDLVMDAEDLQIPHIEMHKRDFVLLPLRQIAPYLRHPILQKTVAEMAENIDAFTKI